MVNHEFYHKKDNLSGLAKLAGNTIPVPSIVNDKPYKGTVRQLTQAEAKTLCVPSIYNNRSFSNLTMASVVDIFSDIHKTGGNDTIAKGCLIDGKIHILAGLRRLWCVLHGDNKLKFNILVVNDMDVEDQKHIAKISDIYEKPSILDLGFKVREIREKSKTETGKAKSYDEIASDLGHSKGKVVEADKFTELPEWLLGKFPGFRYISHKWLRDILKSKSHLGKVKAKITKIDDVTTFDSVEDAEKYSKQLSKEIKRIIADHETSLAKKSKELPSWLKQEPKGVSVSERGKNLTLKFDLSSCDKSKVEKIKALIAE